MNAKTPLAEPDNDPVLTPDAFSRLARAKLLAMPAPRPPHEQRTSPSDYDLNPSMWKPSPPLRAAAVLVPVVAREPLSVLLTQRAPTLSQHAGQIAFPGGRIDGEHETATQAALREAEEEIGLPPQFVTPLGFLDTYRTGTGYSIQPLVGLVKPGFHITLSEGEVAEAFEVPLAFLMNEQNHEMHTRYWEGGDRRFYAMPFEGRFIWGATAGILKNMHKRLFGS